MATTKEQRDELRERYAHAASMGLSYIDCVKISDIADLLDALNSAEAIIKSNDVVSRTYVDAIDLLSIEFRNAEAERDRYKARAEAMERAIKGNDLNDGIYYACTVCANAGCPADDPCASCDSSFHLWQFAEERYG